MGHIMETRIEAFERVFGPEIKVPSENLTVVKFHTAHKNGIWFLEEWCRKNCKGVCFIVHRTSNSGPEIAEAFFELEEDVILFKLTWL